MRALLRRILPSAVLRVARKIFPARHLWIGRYTSFEEVRSSGDGFAGQEYVDADTDNLRSLLESRSRVRAEICNDQALFPLLAAVGAKGNGTMRVVDFGGGVGAWFLYLVEATGGRLEIEYHVIEQPWAVKEGARLFADERRIHFHSDWPIFAQPINLLLMAGVLMCVKDYRGTLERLAGYGASQILMLDLAAGSQPTFASAQKGMGRSSWIPYWFFNAAEIVRIMESQGYSLVFRSAHSSIYDLSNFPPEFRLDDNRPCNLLFRRNP